MAKLQKTIRANGSVIYSMNFPQEIIEQTGWQKGDELELVKNFDRVIITNKIQEQVPEAKKVEVPEKQDGTN